MISNFWKTRMGGQADGGGQGADRRSATGGRTRGERADKGRMGGRWADRRTACRMEVDGRTSGRVHESGRGADKAD